MIYVVGATTMTTSHGSPDNVTFGGTYTGSLTETYTVTVANNTSLGATTNTKNMGSPDDIHFSGTYTGDTSTTYTITITGSGDTFQWSDGLGGTGDVWVTLGPVYLSHGISVVFGSWSYLNKEEWTADVTSTPAFNWTDGHGYSGSGVSPGTDISLSEGVTVSFPTSGYVSDDSWEMTIEYVPDVAPPGNLLYTDSSGKIKSIQTHDLIHASNGLTANAKYFIELGGTLTKATTIALDDNTLNIRNSSYDMGFLATDHLSVISGYPAGARNFVGSTAVGSTVLNGIIATPPLRPILTVGLHLRPVHMRNLFYDQRF